MNASSKPSANVPGIGRVLAVWNDPPQPTDYVPRFLPWRSVLWLTWVVLLTVGGIGLYQRFTQGHLPAGYGSYVPWGLWIAIYFHGVGMAGGAFALGAFGYVCNWPGFQHGKNLRLVTVLAVSAMIPAFFAVWLDLGHLDRFHLIFLKPNFTSMMAFNSWMYTAFLALAGIAWLLSYLKDAGWKPALTGWLKPVLCVGIVFAVLFPSQSGAFFGVVDAKAYWHSALLPVLFLTSALTSGAAMLLFTRVLTNAGGGYHTTEVERLEEHDMMGRLRNFLLAGIGIYFLLEFAEFSISLWNPVAHAPAVYLVLWGPYWWVFWIIHVLIGGILPLALLASRWRFGWTIAALLVGVCFISARLNVLIPGQAVGELRGLQEAFQQTRLSYVYHATLMEYLVGLFCVALGMTIFVVGRTVNRLVRNWFAERSPEFGKEAL